jgi:DNA-binding IclR family transcriptional regulator
VGYHLNVKDAVARGGAQTLARGISALKMVVNAYDGLSVVELAEALDVHRTIASRLLSTLSDADLVAKGRDGRYRGSAGLLGLAGGAYSAIREAALPVLRKLADTLGATVSLMVPEGHEVHALIVVTARDARYKVVFAEGSTHPLNRAAAGYALLSLRPPAADDLPKVIETRERGYSTSFAEVEPNAHGVGVPFTFTNGVEAAVNLITYNPDVAERAVVPMQKAAAELSKLP